MGSARALETPEIGPGSIDFRSRAVVRETGAAAVPTCAGCFVWRTPAGCVPVGCTLVGCAAVPGLSFLAAASSPAGYTPVGSAPAGCIRVGCTPVHGPAALAAVSTPAGPVGAAGRIPAWSCVAHSPVGPRALRRVIPERGSAPLLRTDRRVGRRARGAPADERGQKSGLVYIVN